MQSRTTFLVLAGLAGLCLVGAIAVVALAPASTPIWLAVLLFLLSAVVVAEIVLLLRERGVQETTVEEPAR